MKRNTASALVLAGLTFVALPAVAQSVLVGGQPMVASKSILDNAGSAKDLSTLVATLKASGLDSAISGKGPLTIFAPSNGAFAVLPDGTLTELMKPENKVQLAAILTYHVVAGDYTAGKIKALIKQGHGKAALKTITGGTLIAMMNGSNNIVIKDGKGNVADISVYDVPQSNGVVHVVDKVLMPAS